MVILEGLRGHTKTGGSGSQGGPLREDGGARTSEQGPAEVSTKEPRDMLGSGRSQESFWLPGCFLRGSWWLWLGLLISAREQRGVGVARDPHSRLSTCPDGLPQAHPFPDTVQPTAAAGVLCGRTGVFRPKEPGPGKDPSISHSSAGRRALLPTPFPPRLGEGPTPCSRLPRAASVGFC